jgi:hypothetical protein
MATAAEKLRALGHEPLQQSEWQFLVDGVMHYTLPHGKWFDLVTGERGQKPVGQLHFFVHRRLEERKQCNANKSPVASSTP